jgi:hypothetical protein
MDPAVFETIDLFIFPDIGYGGLQRYLRSVGKAVWGSMGASDIELYRTRFIALLDKLGLEHVNSVKINGVAALAEHLKKVERKWVKINRYRGNMETWFHLNWDSSARRLEKMAVTFGGMADYVVFIVQDEIVGSEDEPVVEIGYDGWTVDGEYPESSFQGYEAKNELYLGSLRPYSKLPAQVRAVNEALAPVFREYGYRNFFASEIRIKGEHYYFIDPTCRMPGQTGEQLLETCTNLAEVIWHGANGELIVPEFKYSFAAEATLHYDGADDDTWKTMRVPDGVRQWVKMYQFCEADGIYHFPPSHSDEVGVILGVDNNPSGCIEDLKDHFDLLEEVAPVSVDFKGFVDLLQQIEDAEEEGVKFTEQEMPAAEEMVT